MPLSEEEARKLQMSLRGREAPPSDEYLEQKIQFRAATEGDFATAWAILQLVKILRERSR